MSSFTPSVRRRVCGGIVLASAAALVVSSLSTVPAGADTVTAGAPGCPTLKLDNPPAGAHISGGKYVVSGAAVDPSASSGTGVGRVEFFLGAREAGGLNLGTAIPGQTNATAPGQLSNPSSRPGGFTVQLDFGNINRGDNLVVYAYSSSSSAVTSVSVPILVGVEPTSTPTGQSNTPVVPKAVTSQQSCNPAAGAPAPAEQVGVVQPSSVVAASAAAAPAVSLSDQGPVFRIDNPRPGNLLPVGDTLLQGIAFDPAASSGSGVDRVEFFAGDRNQGGIFLGGGAPGTTGSPEAYSVKVTINANQNGSATVFGYAHSSVTGRETVLMVPVFLGTSPTPTPHT